MKLIQQFLNKRSWKIIALLILFLTLLILVGRRSVIYYPPNPPCLHLGYSCVIAGFICTNLTFYPDGLEFVLIHDSMPRNLTYFFVGIRGCENYTFDSFRHGEAKTFVFREGKCSKIVTRWWADPLVAWTGDDDVQLGLRVEGCITGALVE